MTSNIYNQIQVDDHDIPISQERISAVLDTLDGNGTSRLWAASRWLNAISVIGLTSHEADILSLLPLVSHIDLVMALQRPKIETRDVNHAHIPHGCTHKLHHTADIPNNLNYGASLRQLEMINVPRLHADGYDGYGVKVMVMDSGFKLSHRAFAHINVADKYDFVNNDRNVDEDPGDAPGEYDHGSKCLSILAAMDNGNMIGVAYNATYFLAKTEDTKSEAPVEEDNIVRALEWAEERGVQLASISLGYSAWYNSNDLDGNTAISTRAVNIAIRKGMNIIVAAGNSGHGGIGAPADAFEAITVGAMDSDEKIAAFSSRGPTADGREKPEVCAMGSGTYLVNPSSVSTYSTGSGTSFSTPLVAGVFALLLQRHPNWSPHDTRQAVLSTARKPLENSKVPNNDFGWGIVDAYAASNFNVGTPGQTDKSPSCENDCNWNGYCHQGICVCFENYAGRACTETRTVCGSHNCINGVCRANKCECRSGWFGPNCADQLQYSLGVPKFLSICLMGLLLRMFLFLLL